MSALRGEAPHGMAYRFTACPTRGRQRRFVALAHPDDPPAQPESVQRTTDGRSVGFQRSGDFGGAPWLTVCQQIEDALAQGRGRARTGHGGGCGPRNARGVPRGKGN